MMSSVNRWLDTKDSDGVDITAAISNLVYKKDEADGLMLDKADKSEVYSKDLVYSKTESDGLLIDKADKTGVYSISDADGLLLDKADTTDVYSKTSSYSRSEITKFHGLFRYPPPVAPNNNTFETKIGTVLSSDNEDRSTAYALFNQNNFSYWRTLNSKYDVTTGVYQGDTRFIIDGGGYSAYGEWIQLSMENAFTLKKLSITTPRINDGTGQAGLAKATARDFSLYGQTGTGPYQLIRRITDVDAVSNSYLEYTVPHVFDFDANTAKYQTHRLVIEKTNRASTVVTGGDGFTYATIGEWGLYGHVTEFVLDHDYAGLNDNTAATYEMII
jgi:hypothetical protein